MLAGRAIYLAKCHGRYNGGKGGDACTGERGWNHQCCELSDSSSRDVEYCC
jgi:hypothetical protein